MYAGVKGGAWTGERSTVGLFDKNHLLSLFPPIDSTEMDLCRNYDTR